MDVIGALQRTPDGDLEPGARPGHLRQHGVGLQVELLLGAGAVLAFDHRRRPGPGRGRVALGDADLLQQVGIPVDHLGERQRSLQVEHRWQFLHLQAHRRPGPEPAGHRFRHHPAGQGGGAHHGSRQPGQCGQHQGGAAHGGQAQGGAVGDAPGQPAAHQDALVEAPVADGRRPGQQEDAGRVGHPVQLPGQAHEGPGHPVEHRRQEEQGQAQRDEAVERVAEGPQLAQGVAVLHQGGGGAHHQDDRRFEHPREPARHPEGGQAVGGVGQPGQDRGEERPLHRHEQPGRLQRRPQAQDPGLGHPGHGGHAVSSTATRSFQKLPTEGMLTCSSGVCTSHMSGPNETISMPG